MKKMLMTAALGSLTSMAFAQNTGAPEDVKYCGSTEQREAIFKDFEPWRVQDSLEQANFEVYYQNYLKTVGTNDRASYVIPVVVHIVHLNGIENISDAQVYDGISILNEDFQQQNADISTVVAGFQNVIGNGDIEFRLATKDPNGNCHKGITRTYSNETYDTGIGGGGHPIVEAVRAEHGTWAQNKYLNIFLCIDPNGAAGYTLTPSSFLPANDMYGGILLRHDYMGSIGTSNYGLSRSLTHEVGHWLNLQHPWGPNNNPGNASSCNSDDGVTDTPNTVGWTSCNLSGTSCGSLDNVQNFMEYSYCSRMFTAGQVTRMHAALNNGTAGRNNLSTSANLIATGVDNPNPSLCKAEFDASIKTICEGETVDFTDASFHNVNSWSWTFQGGTPASSNLQDPTGIVYANSGTYMVTLTAGDGTSNDTETKTAYITVLPADALSTPDSEDFEGITSVPNNKYSLVNNDMDGTWEITSNASGYGNGSKSIYINNSSSDDGKKDEIISNTYDLSGWTSTVVTFDYAFAQRSSNNSDKLSFYVSNNCGKSWSVRKNLTGATLSTTNSTTNSPFSPQATEWKSTTITNISSAYLTSGFRYKIEFTSDGGNNVYVDNINLQGPVGIESLTENMFDLSVFPNPTNGVVNISFDLPFENNVQVKVLDLTGRQVANLMQQNTAGKHTINWNSQTVSSGIYMLTLQVGDQVFSRKLVVE